MSQQIMCVKEYDSEMRNDCSCERCRVEAQIKRLENKIDIVHDIYNKASGEYHTYLNELHHKVGVFSSISYSKQPKINNEYDAKSKKLWETMKESEGKSRKLIYRLASLERQLDLINEDEYYANSESFI